MKSLLAMVPLVAMIVFFFEIKYVFGFMGDTCFCNFKEAWIRVDDTAYHCMDDVGKFYQKFIYIKLVYVCVGLFTFFYQF